MLQSYGIPRRNQIPRGDKKEKKEKKDAKTSEEE
jgi:hypothetical protein